MEVKTNQLQTLSIRQLPANFSQSNPRNSALQETAFLKTFHRVELVTKFTVNKLTNRFKQEKQSTSTKEFTSAKRVKDLRRGRPLPPSEEANSMGKFSPKRIVQEFSNR